MIHILFSFIFNGWQEVKSGFGRVWVRLMRVCRWQFENHGSDHEKTKLKLLEAANLVDKVLSVARH